MTGGGIVGVALATLGSVPINGLRHLASGTTTGWYIWCGEELSDAPGFFTPLCVEHVLDKLPEVADFLEPPPGTRFLLAGPYKNVLARSEPFASLSGRRLSQ